MPHRAVSGSKNAEALSVVAAPMDTRQKGVGGTNVVQAGRIVLDVMMALWSGVGCNVPQLPTAIQSDFAVKPPASLRVGAEYVASQHMPVPTDLICTRTGSGSGSAGRSRIGAAPFA